MAEKIIDPLLEKQWETFQQENPTLFKAASNALLKLNQNKERNILTKTLWHLYTAFKPALKYVYLKLKKTQAPS